MPSKVRRLLKIKGGKYRYYWIGRENFRQNYRNAHPHRPRALERKYGKRVRVYQKKRKEPPPEGNWLKTTLSYECGKDARAWHIDQTKVRPADNTTVEKQEKYCFKFLGRAFTKAIKDRDIIISVDWSRDFPLSKYKEYPYTRDILDSLGIDYVSTLESDGEGSEENLELWRCSERKVR